MPRRHCVPVQRHRVADERPLWLRQCGSFVDILIERDSEGAGNWQCCPVGSVPCCRLVLRQRVTKATPP